MSQPAPGTRDPRPTLIGYLPPLGGITKTGANYGPHSKLINIGDLVYTYAATLLTSGRNFSTWDFAMSAEEINERFSRVLFFIPCRIAPSPYDDDGYSYEFVTRFIEKLEIPFFSLTESIQTRSYDYDSNFHRSLSTKVVRYLKVISEKSPIVGTRGHYSAEVLVKLGIHNVQPLGCPSLYLNGPTLSNRLLTPIESPKNVAVCYSNYQANPHSRIADVLNWTDRQNYYFVEQIFGLVTQALYYPGKISGASIHAAQKVYQDLAPLLSLLRKERVRYFTNYTLWKNFLASMDFACGGARMHGLTPALHAGVPAMFIAHDARVREMCEFFSLPFVAEQALPEQLDIGYFISRCDYSAAHTSYRAAWQKFVSTLHTLGIGDNINAAGNIIDYWEPQPSDRLISEETLPPPGSEFATLENQLAIHKQIPAEVFEKLTEIEALSQGWYQSRLSA